MQDLTPVLLVDGGMTHRRHVQLARRRDRRALHACNAPTGQAGETWPRFPNPAHDQRLARTRQANASLGSR